MKVLLTFFLIFFIGVVTATPLPAEEAPHVVGVSMQTPTRSPVFKVPPELRARVNFWIDIFTRYGEHQVVIHHRDYPQVVFRVLDFRADAARLNSVELERRKRSVVEQNVKEIGAALKHLSMGFPPQTPLEMLIVNKMEFIRGGSSKYRTSIDDRLIGTQTGIREKYIEALQRSGRYLHAMERIFVEDYDLPVELTRLPFIESSFDYGATSKVGAAGIWQFMRRTGMLYMTINNQVDERRDPIESTKAAARYLKQAYSQLGSWPLAIVSYNHGVNGVAKKVRQLGTSNISQIIENPYTRIFGFASNNFYPEFLAALEVYDNYRTYFPNIVIEPSLRVAELELPQQVSVSYVSQELGIEMDELKRLNYGLSQSVWQGRHRIPAGYALKVPARYGTRLVNLKFTEAAPKVVLASTSTPSSRSGQYQVVRGDTLSGISRKFGISIAMLREVNNLSSEALRPGQKLLVRAPEKPLELASNRGVPDRMPMLIPVQKGVQLKENAESPTIYRVQAGDTLWTISRKLDTTVLKLKKANNIRGSKLKIGQELRLP